MSTPDARAGAGLRLMRAAVFAAVCVVLSAAGHAFAAGSAVPLWTLLAGFAAIFVIAASLAGRERSLPSIAGALAGGQLALHALFGAGSHGTGAANATGDHSLIRFAAGLVCGMGPSQLNAAEAHRIVTTAGIDPEAVSQGHDHLASAGAAGAGAVPGATGTAGAYGPVMDLLPNLPMFLGHLLAALATGWLLRRGEIALFRLATLSAHGAQELTAAARLRALRAALALVRALRAGLPGQLSSGPLTLRTAEDVPAPATGDPLQHMVTRRGPPAAYALAA
ncbi:MULTISPECIES: hypothetical protein [unclassified Streptomyces]|uniref:hypothetical protein n=1 Tax=unclassified Streptomyces TaxID=2593676 RepID=UPI002DDC3725|nr:hypothetical protein [Streptomyces sp. NBC_01237]WRZ73751.1 hypothetical protein OG251_20105 [Streptomyces sp. NBC_01237]